MGLPGRAQAADHPGATRPDQSESNRTAGGLRCINGLRGPGSAWGGCSARGVHCVSALGSGRIGASVLRTVLLSIGGFAIVSTLWVLQCSGPQPTTVGAPLVQAPDQPGDPYKVEATVRNDGPGHGEARVLFRLID